MEIEASVRSLSEQQHGVVGRRQLHALGFTDPGIDALDRRAAFEHLSCEVLRLQGTPQTPLTRAMSAVLDSPSGAILSHQSAAALWGVPGFDLRGDFHVTIPRQGVRDRGRLAVIHYQDGLPLSETVLHQGIPVTSPTLLMFHLAAVIHPARAERAYDYLISRRLTSPGRFKNLIDEIGGRGRNGTRMARTLVKADDGRPPPESGFERRVAWLSDEAGVEVRRQVSLGDSDFIGRVDFELIGRPGVIEAQSITYHAAPLSAAEDRERFARLLAIGRSVMTIWDYQAFHHRDHVIEQIQRFARLIDAGRAPFHLECPDP